MRVVLFLFLFLCLGGIHAQTIPSISGAFSDTPGVELIESLEQKSNWTIYYEPAWLDSLTFSGSFTNQPLTEVLDELLKPVGIQYFVEEESVILTNGVAIINQLDIAKKAEVASGPGASPKGLIFSRDYVGGTEASQGVEEKVIEIGARAKLVAGGQSTVVGYVRAAETGAGLFGALVYTEDYSKSASTDENGFYSINLPNGKTSLFFQNVGMKTTKRELVIFSDGKLSIDMEVDVFTLSEVTVEADRDANIKDVKMGVSKINVKETKNVPIVLGERDILKIATTFAGVQTVGEGASGFNVRGGKSDQNLILLNDAPIYNASHFFGFFSVFNSDAIQDLEIYKSSIPAKYGGRLSSVFDIESKAANKEKFEGVGGVSPITSKLTLEIPIVKKKAALMVGGRATYSNWILKRVKNANFKENRVFFADMIMRYDHEISESDELLISGYYSKDNFRLSSDTLFSFSNFSYSNTNASAKWRHKFSDQFRSSLTTYFSSYQYDLEYDESPPNAFGQDFGLDEVGALLDFNFLMDNKHPITFGVGTRRYAINPGTKSPIGEESEIIPVRLQAAQALESFAYGSLQYEWTPEFSVSLGLRYSFFGALGDRQVGQYVSDVPKNNTTQTGVASFDKGEFIKTYHGPEYRLSARYAFDDVSSVKLAFNRNRQYLHTLSNNASLSPTDTWTISDFHIKPQIADQISLGFYRNFFGDKIEASVEGYYKKLQNLLDFKVGAEFLLNDQIEQVILQGPGKSYGVEFSIRKSGKLSGWLNYTFARTFLKLDSPFLEEVVNQGNYYPTNYDKPHTVNLVANYKLTRRISVSMNMNYSTGRPVTYPVGLYEFKGGQTVQYSDRNTFRIPNYFRTDIGISLEEGHRLKKLSHSYWSFSIYNLTGRDNPYSVFFDVQDGEVLGYQLIVFGNPIPTVSFNFRF